MKQRDVGVTAVRDMKKIPRFKTAEEAAKFWEAHSFQDYYDDTKEAGMKFVKRPKKTVTLRLHKDDTKSEAKIAERKGARL